RDIAKTEAYVTSRREWKKIEMLFAHLKRILRLDRLRLRGPFGAQDEFLLAATVQNLRKLIPLPAPLRLQPSAAQVLRKGPQQVGRKRNDRWRRTIAHRTIPLSIQCQMVRVAVPVLVVANGQPPPDTSSRELSPSASF